MQRWFILIAGLVMTIIASSFSVYGLGILFGGGIFTFALFGALDFAKLGMAVAFHEIFEKLTTWYKAVVIMAVVALTIITSAGVYAGLNDGFHEVVNSLSYSERQIRLVEVRLDRLYVEDSTNRTLLSQVNQDISTYRQRLANPAQNTWMQDGQVMSATDRGQRKLLQDQLEELDKQKSLYSDELDTLEMQIIQYEDSISILKLQQNELSEAGPMVFVSTQLNLPIETTSLIFSSFIAIIFDPLALIMITLFGKWQKLEKLDQSNNIEQLPEELIENTEVEQPIESHTETALPDEQIEPIIQEPISSTNIYDEPNFNSPEFFFDKLTSVPSSSRQEYAQYVNNREYDKAAEMLKRINNP